MVLQMYAMGGRDATAQFDIALTLDHHYTESKLFRTFRTNTVGILGDESGEFDIECDEALRDYSPPTSQWLQFLLISVGLFQ